MAAPTAHEADPLATTGLVAASDAANGDRGNNDGGGRGARVGSKRRRSGQDSSSSSGNVGEIAAPHAHGGAVKKRTTLDGEATAVVDAAGLTKAERRKLKKTLKRERALALATPAHAVATTTSHAGAAAADGTARGILGADARASLKLQLHAGMGHGRPSSTALDVKPSQLQDLVLWALTHEVTAPSWVYLHNKSLVSSVVVCMVNSLGPDVYIPAAAPGGALASLPRLFPELAMTTAPGSKKRVHSFMAELFAVPLRGLRKKAAKRAPKHDQLAVHPISAFVLTPEQLEENGFPLEGSDWVLAEPDRYERTPPAPRPTGGARARAELESGELAPEPESEPEPTVYGLDCEMVRTSFGFELARLTLVALDGSVVYDELVRPAREVEDYVTAYSGITPAMLAPVTRDVAQVHRELAAWVHDGVVLVGHSLDNDLRAAKLIHTRCVDTSVLFPDARGPRYKRSLRSLCQQYLGRGIRGAADGGHDSAEDARAALELTKLKLVHGPTFGELSKECESLFEVLARARVPATMIDRPSLVRAHIAGHVSAIPASTDEATIVETIKAVRARAGFVFAQLHDVQSLFAESDGYTDDELAAVLARTAAMLAELAAALPRDALLMVLSGHSNQTEYRRVLDESTRVDIVSAELAAELAAATATARRGIALFHIGQGHDA